MNQGTEGAWDETAGGLLGLLLSTLRAHSASENTRMLQFRAPASNPYFVLLPHCLVYAQVPDTRGRSHADAEAEGGAARGTHHRANTLGEATILGFSLNVSCHRRDNTRGVGGWGMKA